MDWIRSRQFQLVKLPNRHYVFRRNNSGNTEINIPKAIQTKFQARNWLLSHPNAPKKLTTKKAKQVRTLVLVNKSGTRTPLVKPQDPNFLLNKLRASGKTNKWSFNCDLRRQLKVFTQVGKGRQGIVFKASRYTNGRYPFAIKIAPTDIMALSRKETQPAQVEYDIQSAVSKETNGVVKVHQLFKCTDFLEPRRINMSNVQNSRHYNKSEQMVILMEYCDEGSLKSWISKQTAPTDTTMRAIIRHILTTLVQIRQRYPDFNHNDLHLDNIFMSSRGPLIGDFGWSRLERMGTNPAVNTANGTRTASFWGVGPKTISKYDHHLFLNEMRNWIVSHRPERFPQTISFLNMAVPEGYRGETAEHVSSWRLKYEDPCTELPSLTKLIASSYVSGSKRVTSAELVRVKARLRKMGAKLPSPPLITNQELINMSAANFLKLSPSTRTRAKNIRAKAKGKSVVIVKVNLTARMKKAPSPPKDKTKRNPFPVAVLKTAKFNKLVTKIYTTQGGASNEAFNNAWNRARRKAMNTIQNRVNKNLEPFSPSPKKASVPKNVAPSPKKGRVNYKLSPRSGRVKIKAPNSGRFVYANGQTISMAHLKSLAMTLGMNIKGLRSKENIVKKLFSK